MNTDVAGPDGSALSEQLGLASERDALAEELACVRHALPEEWRDRVPSVAVATLTAELELLRKETAKKALRVCARCGRDETRATLNIEAVIHHKRRSIECVDRLACNRAARRLKRKA